MQQGNLVNPSSMADMRRLVPLTRMIIKTGVKRHNQNLYENERRDNNTVDEFGQLCDRFAPIRQIGLWDN